MATWFKVLTVILGPRYCLLVPAERCQNFIAS